MKVEELNHKWNELADALQKVSDYDDNTRDGEFNEEVWNGLSNRVGQLTFELHRSFREYLESEGFCSDFIATLDDGLMDHYLSKKYDC